MRRRSGARKADGVGAKATAPFSFGLSLGGALAASVGLAVLAPHALGLVGFFLVLRLVVVLGLDILGIVVVEDPSGRPA